MAFVAGTLASVGYFDIYFLIALFFIRDVGLDGVYYAIGYFGGHTIFARRMLARMNITRNHLDEVRLLWMNRPFLTMLIGKLSYGIASAFIVVAGVVKMPLDIFFKNGIMVAIIEYGVLLFVGYFFGASFGGRMTDLINNAQYAIAGTALIISAYYLISWRVRGKLLKGDKKIEDSLV